MCVTLPEGFEKICGTQMITVVEFEIVYYIAVYGV